MSKKYKKSKKKTKINDTISVKQTKTKSNIYDFIIIGGGISGLYTAYNILKKNNKIKLLVLEKSNELGGRIRTINYKGEHYEAGAARFNTKQKRILSLIHELGLDDKKIKISNTKDTIFYPKNKYPVLSKKYPLFDDLIKDLNKKNISKTELKNNTILTLVDKYLNSKDIIESNENIKKFCEEKYQYYSEIAILNGYNALKLFTHDLNTITKYFILQGGLTQLIDNLDKNIKTKGGKIKKNYGVNSIKELDNIYCINDEYKARNIICALPKHGLKNINIFKKINNLLNSIKCEPLYRIYAKYPVVNGKCWFHNLPKYSTNLPIKFFIPYNYNTGFIMISYTDSKYADYWLDMIDSEEKLYKNLRNYLEKMFPDREIPDPIWVKHHYWKHGAGYWKKGKNSDKIMPKIAQPFDNKNIFICGENYSEHQAWIEGALQTSDIVLKKLKL